MERLGHPGGALRLPGAQEGTCAIVAAPEGNTALACSEVQVGLPVWMAARKQKSGSAQWGDWQRSERKDQEAVVADGLCKWAGAAGGWMSLSLPDNARPAFQNRPRQESCL